MTKRILLIVTALVSSSAFPIAAAPDKLVITNVNASAAPESATVSWTTNLPATSQLDWGTSASNLSLQKTDASFVTAHSMTITGLQPGTTYFIQITSVSEQGERVVQIVGEPSRAPEPRPIPQPPPAPAPTVRRYSDVPHFTAYVGGGFTMPIGTSDTNKIQDRLDNGWNFMGGAGPRFGIFSLPVDFGYSRMNTKNYIPGVNIDGNMSVWNLTLNPTVHVNPTGILGLYFTGGYGLYSRRLQVVKWEYQGVITCDPWWGFCWGGTFPEGTILGERTTYKGGWNVGAGVTIGGFGPGKFFAEGRYHRMNTTGPDTEYIPLSFGFRW